MGTVALLHTGKRDSTSRGAPAVSYEDPLEPDARTDVAVATTRRGLTRLALVAAETGARFQREGIGHDPMAWMLAPRMLFGGSSAIEAALERDNCLRGVMLHALSLGLDAEPQTLDVLMADGPGAPGHDDWSWDDGGSDGGGSGPVRRRMRLYSAVMVIPRGGELVHLFHASVAPSSMVVRERIRSRFGSAAADQAEIQIGVDLDDEATKELLPPAFRKMMASKRRIRWSSFSNLDVTVEHRIPC